YAGQFGLVGQPVAVGVLAPGAGVVGVLGGVGKPVPIGVLDVGRGVGPVPGGQVDLCAGLHLGLVAEAVTVGVDPARVGPDGAVAGDRDAGHLGLVAEPVAIGVGLQR